MYDDYWELMEDRQDTRMIQPINPFDPLTEPIPSPMLANPEKQKDNLLEINGLLYDLDVEEGLFYDQTTYDA